MVLESEKNRVAGIEQPGDQPEVHEQPLEVPAAPQGVEEAPVAVPPTVDGGDVPLNETISGRPEVVPTPAEPAAKVVPTKERLHTLEAGIDKGEATLAELSDAVGAAFSTEEHPQS